MDMQTAIEADRRRLHREMMTRRVLHILRDTIDIRPVDSSRQEFPPFYVEMTDKSARAIAPLIEAIDILESIIWASDGCQGHRHCAHSMEPWQRARALLDGKWRADSEPGITWPDVEGEQPDPRD